MTALVTSWLGRIFAVWIAGLCMWLLVHYHIAIPADAQTKVVEALVSVVIPILVSIYGVLHKLIDAKLNPTDAAAPDVIEHDKRTVAQKRAMRTL